MGKLAVLYVIFTSGVCHFCKYINKHIDKDRFIFNPFTLLPESGLETYPGKVVKWICIRFIFNLSTLRRGVVWEYTPVKWICIG